MSKLTFTYFDPDRLWEHVEHYRQSIEDNELDSGYKDEWDWITVPLIHEAKILLHNCVAMCGAWEEGHLGRIRRIPNKLELESLLNRVYELAETGYKNRTKVQWLTEDEAELIEFWEYPVADWAVIGREGLSAPDISEAQIYATNALLAIDEGIRHLQNSGWDSTATSCFLHAYFLYCEAQSSEYRDRRNLDRSISQELLIDNYRRQRSDFYRRIAHSKHQKSPKRLAKNFINECWKEWQENPQRYTTQTEFANDVLQKIEIDKEGNPIISFDTITKKWIPEWNKQKRDRKK